MFEDDNGPKHTASAVKAYSDRKNTQWKACSTGLASHSVSLNIIEVRSFWQRTERKAAEIQRRTLESPSRSLENTSINDEKITGGTYHVAVSVYARSCLKGTERNLYNVNIDERASVKRLEAMLCIQHTELTHLIVVYVCNSCHGNVGHDPGMRFCRQRTTWYVSNWDDIDVFIFTPENETSLNQWLQLISVHYYNI